MLNRAREEITRQLEKLLGDLNDLGDLLSDMELRRRYDLIVGSHQVDLYRLIFNKRTLKLALIGFMVMTVAMQLNKGTESEVPAHAE